MQKDIKQEESFSPEVQEALRSIVLAIRTVRLYPPNNPAYSNAVKKSFNALNNFLQTDEEYRIGVNKNYFTFKNLPFGKDADLNKPIAYDLFAKEIREIVFLNGLTESELLHFYQTLALSTEDCKMKGGISSIIWEMDLSHIKITEAGLDEVITTQAMRDWEEKKDSDEHEPPVLKKATSFPGRTLVLVDLCADPSGFGANMIELAKQTKAEHETVEDRLFALYKEAGRKIDEEHPAERETLYEGLAKSALALDPQYRNGFIADKLYGELDAEIEDEEANLNDEYLPGVIHEVKTGRFSDTWTVQQVTTLLKKAASKQTTVTSLSDNNIQLQAAPIDPEIIELTKNMNIYSEEDMEELQALSDKGTEMDTMRSSAQALISLIPLVKNPQHVNPEESDIAFFSSVILQIENVLEYFLKKKDYEVTTQIVQALRLPVETTFQPSVNEALKKVLSKSSVIAAIEEVRKNPKNSFQYHFARSYLTAFELESTQIILELLAEEKDRVVRIFYLDLAKDIGKNQISLLGRRLSDMRWYVVRNIVKILGESKTDQAIAFLRGVAGHKDVRIRQEIIQGLIHIGGKKAAGVLTKFLEDKDNEVKIMAIRAFSSFVDITPVEAKPLMEFLDKQPLKKKEQNFTMEAVKSLGKIGDHNSAIFLKRYDRIRWWKSRKLQKELRAAALQAMKEISRRHG